MMLSWFTLIGCSIQQNVDCSTVTIDNDAHTNIALFSWSSDAAGTASITYTVDGESLTRTVSESTTTEHSTILLGLPALTDITWSATTTIDGNDEVCEGEFTTRNLPSGQPQLEVTVSESGQSEERYMLGLAQEGDQTHPFILDRKGQWVWYWPGSQVQSSMLGERAADGNGMLFSSFSYSRGIDEGTVYRVSMLGEDLESLRITLGHHVFDQVPHADLAYLAIDVRDWIDSMSGQAEPVVGDAIVEIQDGEEVTIFSTWDWAEPTVHDEWTSTFYPQGRDWTHANSLHFDPDDETYLVSLAHPKTILQVDRSGTIIDEISENTHSFADEELVFMEQHDVRWTDSGTLIMFNHYPSRSVCVEYEITDDAITPIWTHGLDETIVGSIQGQCYRMANGNTLVNFGGAGIVREVTTEGEVLWEVQSGLGSWISNVEMFSDIYFSDAYTSDASDAGTGD